MVLQAFLDDGNEILVPAPDYPLWTGAVSLSGGTAGALPLRRGERLGPRPRRHRGQDHPEHPGAGDHQPEQPDRARSTARTTVKGLVDIARRHELVVFSDEIYEKILFDDAVHRHTAAYAGDDVLCLTFSGLSKAYRVCGYRAGWVMVSGPKHLAEDFLEGLTLLANMRMCPNVPGAARDPDGAGRLPVDQRVHPPRRPLLRAEQGRLAPAQRDPGRQLRRAARGAVLLPAARPGRLPHQGRRAVRARPAARQEDPGHPRHRLQLVRARPLPPGHPARPRDPHRGHRPDRATS